MLTQEEDERRKVKKMSSFGLDLNEQTLQNPTVSLTRKKVALIGHKQSLRTQNNKQSYQDRISSKTNSVESLRMSPELNRWETSSNKDS